MDYYLNPENSSNRLLDEYNKYGTLVVAFDFGSHGSYILAMVFARSVGRDMTDFIFF